MGDYKKQADLACRISKIASAYDSLAQNSDSDVYEATLHLCLLQNLLTSCYQMWNDGYRDQGLLREEIRVTASSWGLTKVMIESRFGKPLTHGFVLEQMRHAVSHPCLWTQQTADRPRSGYRSINPVLGKITKYQFINSPDVDEKGAVKVYNKTDAEKIKGIAENCLSPMTANSLQIKNSQGGYNVWYKPNGTEKLFVRYCKVTLPVQAMQQLVSKLSCCLVQMYENDARRRPERA